MIAVVTSSGAFLYDLTVKQADELCQTVSYTFSREMIGWLFHSSELPYRLQNLGVTTCYVDLHSIDDKRKDKSFCKVSLYHLTEIWEKVFPIKEFFTAAEYNPIERTE